MNAVIPPESSLTTPLPADYRPTARRPIAEAFRRTARGAVDFCVRYRIHPDAVSYSSILAAAVAAGCFVAARWHPWLLLIAPAGMYARLWLNMLDGMVALGSGTASRRGEILNELPDRLSDVLIFAGAAHSGFAHQALGYWAAIFALFTAYVGIFGQAVGAKREFAGVMSKPWRMVALHLGAWLALIFVWTGHRDARLLHLTVLDWTCMVVIVGCVQTIAVRLASTLRLIDATPRHAVTDELGRAQASGAFSDDDDLAGPQTPRLRAPEGIARTGDELKTRRAHELLTSPASAPDAPDAFARGQGRAASSDDDLLRYQTPCLIAQESVQGRDDTPQTWPDDDGLAPSVAAGNTFSSFGAAGAANRPTRSFDGGDDASASRLVAEHASKTFDGANEAPPSPPVAGHASKAFHSDNEAPSSRPVTEHTFRSFDGAELFYRAWIPDRTTSKALIILHRGHEHSGRMSETVDRLALDDVAVFAWDQRGHGRSPGERGGADSLADVIKDLDCFAKHLVAAHGVKLADTVLLAHSVGGVIGAAWVHDYAPPLRGLILATPALRVKLYVPLAIAALRLKQRFLGPGHVTSYVKSRVLTHDPRQQAAYDADPLIFRQIAINILLDLHDTSTRLLDDAGAITTPTLILAAGNDWVVKESAQRRFFQRLSAPVKEFEVFEGSYHAIFHETNRPQVVARVKKFIGECFERPAADDDGIADSDRLNAGPLNGSLLNVDLLNADRAGYTRSEFDRLRGPSLNPVWPVTRIAMKTVCRLSDGIRLGWRAGFDSGVTLDYVYANRPAGTTPIGKLIDYNYLNSPGWRGIRQRRINLEAFLRRAIDETLAAGRPARIVDIASGPGRYVLETISKMSSAAAGASANGTAGVTADVSAVLRDYKLENLGAARALADELGLGQRVVIAHADAFDRESIASTFPRPTIGIVSGLYELFPENEPVRRSLGGLADAIEPGGFLIYTCQPWHPQVEFIARVLTNREGRPWVMRRRTPAEMDALVRAAGFEKVDQAIDRWGIFTVGLARRV